MTHAKLTSKPSRHAVIPVRMLTETCDAITRAADRLGKSRSAFMREASERRARVVLRKLEGEPLSPAA